MSRGLIDMTLNKLVSNSILETGTSGSWKYTKYADHTYQLVYESGFALNAGSTYGNGGIYYHKTTYGLPLPSWALTWRIRSAVKSDGIIMWCVGGALENDGLHLYWVNASSASLSGSTFGNSSVVVVGTW